MILNISAKFKHNIPNILYKYRAFDSLNIGQKLAIDAELYFSSPFKLNDPFETYFIPYSRATELSDSELRVYIDAKTSQHFPSISQARKKSLNEIAYRRFEMFKSNPEIIANELHELQNKKFGILSLTSNNSSLPMWAYYANNHKGFCVGINTGYLIDLQRHYLEENIGFIQIHRVNYTNDLPKACIDTPVDGNGKYETELENIHYTKSHEWKHEEEYRVIFWDNPNTVIKLYPEAVSEIIFGLNASDENIENMKSRLKDINPSVKLFLAKKKSDSFGIELIKQ